MRRRVALGFMFGSLVLLSGAGPARGDTTSAAVLPKGVFRFQADAWHYFPMTERFDKDGNTQSIATDFNATLNSSAIEGLGALDDAFFGGAQVSNVGTTVVDFEYQTKELDLWFQYGLTDKVTVYAHVPYWWKKTNLKQAYLDNSGATVGFNPLYQTACLPPELAASPFLPFNFLDPFPLPPQCPKQVIPVTTADILNLIGPGVDINGDGTIDIAGYGYKPFKTWEENGFGDVDVGARYQYYKSENWRLAFTGAVQIPTGKVADPDELLARSFGTGAWGLLFRLNNDYTGIKDLVLDLTLKYDLILSSKQTVRVPNRVNAALVPLENKEEVSKNTGDVMELNVSGDYQFAKGWHVLAGYVNTSKQKDKISGDKGLNYQALEEQSDWAYQLFSGEVSYSTVPLFVEKKFRVPMDFGLYYENVFAGKNKFPKQESISLRLAVYF